MRTNRTPLLILTSVAIAGCGGPEIFGSYEGLITQTGMCSDGSSTPLVMEPVVGSVTEDEEGRVFAGLKLTNPAAPVAGPDCGAWPGDLIEDGSAVVLRAMPCPSTTKDGVTVTMKREGGRVTLAKEGNVVLWDVTARLGIVEGGRETDNCSVRIVGELGRLQAD